MHNDKNFKFRNLKPDEIEARVGNIVVKNGAVAGVSVLLYKSARCDMDILDETAGPLGWQRTHTRDNKNCIVSIYDNDTGVWVSKEDVGSPSNAEAEKGLASDSFKRCCVNWGIGRELYSSPKIFFYGNELKNVTVVKDSNGKDKGYCNDTFEVVDVQYVKGEKKIESVTVAALDRNGKAFFSKTFGNTNTSSPQVQTKQDTQPAEVNKQTTSKPAETPAANAPAPEPANAKPAEQAPAPQTVQTTELTDDTVFLFGSCRKKRYGDIKGTSEFTDYVNWIKTASPSYDGAIQAQFDMMKELIANGKL